MLSHACEQVIQILYENQLVSPRIESSEQERVLRQWKEEDVMEWDCGDGGEGGEYAILDSVFWTTRRRRLPIIAHVTN